MRARWWRQQTPLVVARMTYRIHACAAAMIVGALGGLYLRGLARAYTFHWQSTFVPDEAREEVLRWAFAPVLWLSGNTVPPLEGANGAQWIHILALTALIYAVLPRLLLVVFWRLRAARLAKRVTVDVSDAFFRQLLARRTTLERYLSLVGYSYRLQEEREEKLLASARVLWGERTRHHQTVKLEWGTEVDLPELQDGLQHLLWVCFNGAQTPEEEVHTPFAKVLASLRHHTEATIQVTVIVDHGGVDDAIKPRRHDAWAEVLRAGGVSHFCWTDLRQDVKIIVDDLAQSANKGS